MLNVNRLRMLREVASRKTIAAAAEALYLSPSAVSQQMSVLEREAGVLLLEREGRGVRLTQAGERLVASTERILAEIERAEAELASASRGTVGHVRVSAFPTAARTILVPALVRLQDEHPNLRVSMIDLEPEESLPALKARDLDVVVAYEWSMLPTVRDPGVEREELLREPVYLALPEHHPLAQVEGDLTVADFANEEWIVGRDSTSMLELVTATALTAGFEPRTDFHSMDFEVILAAVAAGLGIALVPPLALSVAPEGIVTRPLTDVNIYRTIWAATRRGSGSTPGIAVVLNALRDASSVVSDYITER